jgi:exodeoxyribonuclease V alpha subunit
VITVSIDLDEFCRQMPLEALDWLFARAIMRLSGDHNPYLGLAAALVSRVSGQGHVCLDLEASDSVIISETEGRSRPLPAPTAAQWRKHLEASIAVGRPGDFRPLILDGRRLYLHRYWHYENELAQSILRRCHEPPIPVAEPRFTQTLTALFGARESAQHRAARRAATRRFSIISGGPGSGKTYTIARIILLLKTLAAGAPHVIRLAAPTGKAAARMREAVENAMRECSHPAETAWIETSVDTCDASTLHRLLGYSPTNGRFAYSAENHLPADAVIVDEASMIDLELMAALIRALPPAARLVLVGDKDQLASVEAGALLGDMCHGIGGPLRSNLRPNKNDAPLRHSITVLDKPYRFDPGGGIASLSGAINAGEAQAAIALLTRGKTSEVEFRPITHRQALAAALEEEVLKQLAPLYRATEAGEALAGLNRFRILAVVRQGPFGVIQLNALVEQILRQHGWIDPRHDAWYPLRPVMVARNDYTAGLFNGDVGITFAGPSPPNDSTVQVAFADGHGGVTFLAPHQLPAHETVYAMTVHKSQGSEFERVVVVLPDQDLPLLTRELLYTAVTRARGSVAIWGDPQLVAAAVRRRIRRASGLREALWGVDAAETESIL